MSMAGVALWRSLPNTGGNPAAISPELNAAWELRNKALRRDRIARAACRYLDEHCDSEGHRVEGGMSQDEYAIEAGIHPTAFERATRAERKRRGVKGKGNNRSAQAEQ